MNVAEKIAQIRAYAITAKTAIYNEDAMTAIELAGVTACKVNECVNAINMIVEVLDTITSNNVLYDENQEQITII